MTPLSLASPLHAGRRWREAPYPTQLWMARDVMSGGHRERGSGTGGHSTLRGARPRLRPAATLHQQALIFPAMPET